MPLQKLVGNVYSVIMEILLWLVPIAGAVSGYYATELVFYGGNRVLWILIGIVAGLLLDVLFFGPAIILLNIRASLKNIESKR